MNDGDKLGYQTRRGMVQRAWAAMVARVSTRSNIGRKTKRAENELDIDASGGERGRDQEIARGCSILRDWCRQRPSPPLARRCLLAATEVRY